MKARLSYLDSYSTLLMAMLCHVASAMRGSRHFTSLDVHDAIADAIARLSVQLSFDLEGFEGCSYTNRQQD